MTERNFLCPDTEKNCTRPDCTKAKCVAVAAAALRDRARADRLLGIREMIADLTGRPLEAVSDAEAQSVLDDHQIS